MPQRPKRRVALRQKLNRDLGNFETLPSDEDESSTEADSESSDEETLANLRARNRMVGARKKGNQKSVKKAAKPQLAKKQRKAAMVGCTHNTHAQTHVRTHKNSRNVS
jgi:hypothetical protein